MRQGNDVPMERRNSRIARPGAAITRSRPSSERPDAPNPSAEKHLGALIILRTHRVEYGMIDKPHAMDHLQRGKGIRIGETNVVVI